MGLADYSWSSSSPMRQEKLKLTLEQAIETGLANSKTLHASSMKVVSAGAKIKEVNRLRTSVS